jgi:hypothetical protein
MNISHSSAFKGSGTIHTAHPSHGRLDKLELGLIPTVRCRLGNVTLCLTMKRILVILQLLKAVEQFIQLIQIMDG